MSTTTDHHLKINNNTLTKEEQDDFLRQLLPACQPQEGSPANTFTQSELADLQRAVGSIKIGPPRASSKNEESSKASTSTASSSSSSSSSFTSNNKVDIRDVQQAFHPPIIAQAPPQPQYDELLHETSIADIPSTSVACPQGGDDNDSATNSTNSPASNSTLDWHGAPRPHEGCNLSRAFREKVREGKFTKPTNGVCPGFLQCNLVVLPQGPIAFDFLLFCQRNPKACPLIEVCDVGSPHPNGVAPGADLRTDVPK